ncbi:protein-glutamine gamma-glutamyltransferase 5 [Stegastes partitus]|uniref:protein-glutamine gamma-glutamyltransferase n=1 Tax=Stegastes partitus TaxID=144197 RepID=A0A9Y4NB97_9TELE|nr:PREDICTED: protein-glutamine gamma-glutamyltransferase Z [Stegastes partitus]
MTEELKKPIFSGVDFQSAINNLYHRTSEITSKRLIVRRGDTFTIKLSLTQPFKPEDQQLVITAKTGGQHASEDLGTLSRFGYPDNIKRSPSAKAVWKLETRRISPPPDNTVTLAITPPADAPVGEYELFGKLLHEERLLGKLVVLFNPWSLSDTVYLSDEERRQEYVLNEHGVIFKGSVNYIFPAGWDYGQFEENMVDICLKILDRNSKHLENPAEDVAARSDPIYVGRVVSAMINSEDDNGVLEGSWDPPYIDGKRPTHWTGSYAILDKWFQEGQPVKYGQCWVFAGVMCSVLRLLGIPCRVVTNFSSAHDVDMNLTIDTYYDSDGVKREEDNMDSICKIQISRRDLGDNNKWGGWQALDPTPQETSDGIYCCGPAPVKAILDGYTDFKYDVPFVFAEVNADCIDWLVGSEGELYPLNSDTKRVGQFISTKCVGSKQREDITNTYKHAEGSYKERMTFVFATTRDYSKTDEEWWLEDEEFMEWMEEGAEDEKMEEEAGSGGTDGGAESGATPAEAGSGATPAEAGSAGTAAGAGSDETLTNCTLTLSGAGLFKADVDCQIPDLQPNNRIRVKFFFVPYKKGEKTITADFDCATFRDIKGSCTVNVV